MSAWRLPRWASVAGKERLGCVGSLPISRCGCPVERCPLAVVSFVAAPGCGRVLVVDGSAFVRLRCAQEGLNAGGKRLLCRGLGDGRVMLCFYELLTGGHRMPASSGARFSGGTVSFTGARFSVGTVDFTGARFAGGKADFRDAGDWRSPPQFSWTGMPPSGVMVSK